MCQCCEFKKRLYRRQNIVHAPATIPEVRSVKWRRTITRLLAIITALSLCEQRSLASLVLRDLVEGVLLAVSALACHNMSTLSSRVSFPMRYAHSRFFGSLER